MALVNNNYMRFLAGFETREIQSPHTQEEYFTLYGLTLQPYLASPFPPSNNGERPRLRRDLAMEEDLFTDMTESAKTIMRDLHTLWFINIPAMMLRNGEGGRSFTRAQASAFLVSQFCEKESRVIGVHRHELLMTALLSSQGRLPMYKRVAAHPKADEQLRDCAGTCYVWTMMIGTELRRLIRQERGWALWSQHEDFGHKRPA